MSLGAGFYEEVVFRVGLFGVGAFVYFANFNNGKKSIIAAALTLAVMTLPVIIASTKEALSAVPRSFREACWNVGATRWQTFRLVILPSITPALMTGFAMAFARAVGEYGSVIFIAGNMPMVSEITPLIIIGKLEQYDYAGATAVAVVMLVISFILLLIINALQAWQRRHAGAPA